jgi:hypothetical protein
LNDSQVSLAPARRSHRCDGARVVGGSRDNEDASPREAFLTRLVESVGDAVEAGLEIEDAFEHGGKERKKDHEEIN